VDRLDFDVEINSDFPIVIDGFISDQPGPYIINVSKAFDIESKSSQKAPVSVKQIVISDNKGNSETLTESSIGVYKTKPNGIRGIVGNVYKIRVELPAGEVFESTPDTLVAGSAIDTLYSLYENETDISGKREDRYRFFIDTQLTELSGIRFKWFMVATFQAETRPDLDDSGCYYEDGRCNFRPPCSGLVNQGYYPPNLIQASPCTCCTCWYKLYSPTPTLSDDYYSGTGLYRGVDIGTVPVTPWTFMHKVKVVAYQSSVSKNTFTFFKAIRDQKEAINSIFQPVTGRIPGNFVQLNGNPRPLQGIFYATALRSKSMTLNREDFAEADELLTLEELVGLKIGMVSCLSMFPNATNEKPSDWDD
jgi:hypothetical protein